jgi:hypothetical protein
VSELPHQEFLFTVAEVAAAFVGFSLIGSILRPDDEDPRFLMMRGVAEVSLVAVAGSLLPYLLFQFDVQGEPLWRTSSGGLALAWLVGGGLAYRRANMVEPAWRWAPALFAFGSLGSLSGLGLLIWSVSIGGPLSGPRYMVALSVLLALAGLQFIWATFLRPSGPSAV